MQRIRALGERLRLSLWFIPALAALLASAGAVVSLTLDASLSQPLGLFRFGGTADAARDVLATIAQSMLTFTGLVFTVTMLVLQLAANQMSPRVMRTFLRDRQNQLVLGLFVATFVFTLLVLREVRSGAAGTRFVPGISIWIAFALLLASVAAFVIYIDHMAHAIRASTVIANIGKETREVIERTFPKPEQEPDQEPSASEGMYLPGSPVGLIPSHRPGTLVAIEADELLDLASRENLAIALAPQIGDFVPAGAPLYRVYGQGKNAREPAEELLRGLREAATFAQERTLQQDVAFGFRQLVDIGVRALSPGTNDPTTAVQAIDQLHDLLRELARRPFPPVTRYDESGNTRLIVGRPGWPDLVALAVEELRLYGGGHLQIARRLRAMLDDLYTAAPPDRRAVLAEELERLDRAVERQFEDRRDRARAARPSARGQGEARHEPGTAPRPSRDGSS